MGRIRCARLGQRITEGLRASLEGSRQHPWRDLGSIPGTRARLAQGILDGSQSISSGTWPVFLGTCARLALGNQELTYVSLARGILKGPQSIPNRTWPCVPGWPKQSQRNRLGPRQHPQPQVPGEP